MATRSGRTRSTNVAGDAPARSTADPDGPDGRSSPEEQAHSSVRGAAAQAPLAGDVLARLGSEIVPMSSTRRARAGVGGPFRSHSADSPSLSRGAAPPRVEGMPRF